MTQTPFEASGLTTWTSLAEESALIDTLATSGRATVEVMGHSPSGNHPIRLITVAMPETPADAPTVLVIGLQHGNEPAGREAALALMRDLVETTDPALVNLLSRCRFAFIPTANPSGFPSSRLTQGAGGGDMNRDHLSLTIQESEYVQRVITRLHPVLVVDCHEWPGMPSDGAWLLANGNPLGDGGLEALGADMLADVRGALTDQGIGNDLYPGPFSPRPETLRPSATLRNSLFLLIETPANGIPPARRFYIYQIILPAMLAWVQQNLLAAVAAQQEADQSMTIRGGSRASFDFGEGVSVPALPEGYIIPKPAPPHVEIFGLEYWDRGDHIIVPLAQRAFPLIPFLFDPESPLAVVAAELLGLILPPSQLLPRFSGKPLGAKVRLGGIVYEVDRILVRHGGETHRAFY